MEQVHHLQIDHVQIDHLDSNLPLYDMSRRICAVQIQHGLATHRKNTEYLMKTKIRKVENKKSVPSDAIISRLVWNTLSRSEQKSYSRELLLGFVRCPPLLRPPRHRFGPSNYFLPFGPCEHRRPPRVKPGARRGPRCPARQFWCSDCDAFSMKFSLVA